MMKSFLVHFPFSKSTQLLGSWRMETLHLHSPRRPEEPRLPSALVLLRPHATRRRKKSCQEKSARMRTRSRHLRSAGRRYSLRTVLFCIPQPRHQCHLVESGALRQGHRFGQMILQCIFLRLLCSQVPMFVILGAPKKNY